MIDKAAQPPSSFKPQDRQGTWADHPGLDTSARRRGDPIGRRMDYAGFSPIVFFKYTKYPNAAREYLRFMFERDQYEAWENASFGYVRQTLKAYESNPIWTGDSKITPFRDGGALSLYAGYAGKVGPASAGCSADFIIPNMVAEAVSGQLTSKDAVARAEQRARRYYKA